MTQPCGAAGAQLWRAAPLAVGSAPALDQPFAFWSFLEQNG
jgi:hypothetical protein